MDSTQTLRAPFARDAVARTGLGAVVLAGAVATVAFDLFGQGLSPLAGFARLAPVGLAESVLQVVLGGKIAGAGHFLHYLAGLVAYPLGWLLIAAPAARRIAPWAPRHLVAVLYGVALWVFALFFMAHLIAGLPAFLGFSGIAWVALLGHVIYALALAGTLHRLQRTNAAA